MQRRVRNPAHAPVPQCKHSERSPCYAVVLAFPDKGSWRGDLTISVSTSRMSLQCAAERELLPA